jgi:hypothetical protein
MPELFHATPRSYPLPIFFGAVATGFILWSLIREKRRTFQVQARAARLHYTYLGDSLPKSFSVAGTELQGLSKVWNVCDGEFRGVRALFFDCRMREGKGSWRRTVLALQTDDWRRVGFKAAHELTVNPSGDWLVFFQSRTSWSAFDPFIPVDESEVYFSESSTNA